MDPMPIVALTTVSAILWGCSHSAPAPKTAETYPSTAGMTPASGPGENMQAKQQSDGPTRSQISISDEIKKACGISDPDSYFAFDSARLTPQDEKVAKQLADCFTAGPMTGRIMRLVGHADPRGNEEYNMVLGQHRADNVKQFLVQRGLTSNVVQTSSRGKMDARGTDEATWALDRRVDVMAAQ